MTRLLAAAVTDYNFEALARWFPDNGQSGVVSDFVLASTDGQRQRARDALVAAIGAGDAGLVERLLPVRPADAALTRLKAVACWCAAIRSERDADAVHCEPLL